MSTLDMDAIKGRLAKLQNTQSKKDSIWKPSGNHKIRIVPYKFDKSNPFIELYFHYGINNRSYLSPMSYEAADPFVEFADKLKQTGDKESWQQSRKFQPKLRTYVPIIVRGKEDEGVKFWGFGKTVYEELLGYISDPDYGDITDPKNGRDVNIEWTKAEGPDSWPKTKVRVSPKVTPLTTDKDIFLKLMDDQPDIFTIYEKVDYDTLDGILQAWIDPSSADKTNEESEELSVDSKKLPFEPDAPVAAEKSKDKSVSDTEDEFEQLFNS